MMQHIDFVSFSFSGVHDRAQLLKFLDKEGTGDLLLQARNYMLLSYDRLEINAHIRLMSSTGFLQDIIDLSFAIHEFHTFETIYFQIEKHISKKVIDLFIDHGGILYRCDRSGSFPEYFLMQKVITLECTTDGPCDNTQQFSVATQLFNKFIKDGMFSVEMFGTTEILKHTLNCIFHGKSFTSNDIFSPFYILREAACKTFKCDQKTSYKLFLSIFNLQESLYADCFIDYIFSKLSDDYQNVLLEKYLNKLLTERLHGFDYSYVNPVIAYTFSTERKWISKYIKELFTALFNNKKLNSHERLTLFSNIDTRNLIIRYMLSYNPQELFNNIPRHSFRSTFTFSSALKPLPVLKNISKISDMLWIILLFSIASNDAVIEQFFSFDVNEDNEQEVELYEALCRNILFIRVFNENGINFTGELFKLILTIDTFHSAFQSINNFVHEFINTNIIIKREFGIRCIAVIQQDKLFCIKINGSWYKIINEAYYYINDEELARNITNDMNEDIYFIYGDAITLEYGYSGNPTPKLITLFSDLSLKYRFIDSIDINTAISKDIDKFLLYTFLFANDNKITKAFIDLEANFSRSVVIEHITQFIERLGNEFIHMSDNSESSKKMKSFFKKILSFNHGSDDVALHALTKSLLSSFSYDDFFNNESTDVLIEIIRNQSLISQEDIMMMIFQKLPVLQKNIKSTRYELVICSIASSIKTNQTVNSTYQKLHDLEFMENINRCLMEVNMAESNPCCIWYNLAELLYTTYDDREIDLDKVLCVCNRGPHFLYETIFNVARRDDERMFNRLYNILLQIVKEYKPPSSFSKDTNEHFIQYIKQQSEGSTILKYYKSSMSDISYEDKHMLPDNVKQQTEFLLKEEHLSKNEIIILMDNIIFYDDIESFTCIQNRVIPLFITKNDIVRKCIKYTAQNIFNILSVPVTEDLMKTAIYYNNTIMFRKYNRAFASKKLLLYALENYDLFAVISSVYYLPEYTYGINEINPIQYLSVFYCTLLGQLFFEHTNNRSFHDAVISDSSCELPEESRTLFKNTREIRFIYFNNSCFIDSSLQLLYSLDDMHYDILFRNHHGVVETLLLFYQILAYEGYRDIKCVLFRAYLEHVGVAEKGKQGEANAVLCHIITNSQFLHKMMFLKEVVYKYNCYVKNKNEVLYELYEEQHVEDTYFKIGRSRFEYTQLTNIGIAPNINYDEIGIDIHQTFITHYPNYVLQNTSGLSIKLTEDVQIKAVHYKAVALIYHIGDNHNAGHFVTCIKSRSNWIEINDMCIKNCTGQTKAFSFVELISQKDIAFVVYKRQSSDEEQDKLESLYNIECTTAYKVCDDSRRDSIKECLLKYSDGRDFTHIQEIDPKIIEHWIDKYQRYTESPLEDQRSKLRTALDSPLFIMEINYDIDKEPNLQLRTTDVSHDVTDRNLVLRTNRTEKENVSIQSTNQISIPNIFIPPSAGYQIIAPFKDIVISTPGLIQIPQTLPIDYSDMPDIVQDLIKIKGQVSFPNIFVNIRNGTNLTIPSSFVWYIFQPHEKWEHITSKTIILNACNADKFAISTDEITDSDLSSSYYTITDNSITSKMQALSSINIAREKKINYALKREIENRKKIHNLLLQEVMKRDIPRILIESIMKKVACKSPKGMKYSEEYKKVWIQAHFRDPGITSYLRDTFDGPARSTTQSWIKEAIDEIPRIESWKDVNCINEILDFWCKKLDIHLMDCIIAIDAMHVTTRVVAKDHNIHGVIEVTKITPEEHQILQDKGKFLKYVALLKQYGLTSEAEFVILLIPLSRARPLPIHFHPKNNGSASQNEIDILTTILETLKSKYTNNFRVFGMSADGDRQYISLETKFTQKILELIDSTNSLVHTIKEIKIDTMINPDAPHLMKRLRNNITNKEAFISIKGISLSREALKKEIEEELLYDVLFTNKNTLKMDDSYPRELFTPKAIKKLITQNKHEYLHLMFPATTIRIAFYNKAMKRKDRLQILAIGFFYMLIIKKNIDKSSNIYTNEQINDFINLCIHLMKIISTAPEEMSISRGGTFDLEHFFAIIRSLCEGDDSSMNVEQIFLKLFTSIAINENSTIHKKIGTARPAYLEQGVAILTDEDEFTARRWAVALIKKSSREIDCSFLLKELSSEEIDDSINSFMEWFDKWQDPISNIITTNKCSIDQKQSQTAIDSRIRKNIGMNATLSQQKKNRNEHNYTPHDLLAMIG